MKTIITIFTIILSITIVSAITIYSGECNSIEFPNTEEVNWSVEGNSSNMNGFLYTKNGTTITYCFHPLYKPDSFTLTFYNYQEVIVKEDSPVWYSFGGGGTSSTSKTIVEDDDEISEIQEPEPKEEETLEQEEEDKSSIWPYIIVGFIVVLVITIIYKLVKNKDEENS